MRLIEVAGLVNHVENVRSMLQQAGGIAGAFDLTKAALRQACSVDEVPLHRPGRTHAGIAGERRRHRLVPRDHAALRQAMDESVDRDSTAAPSADILTL